MIRLRLQPFLGLARMATHALWLLARLIPILLDALLATIVQEETQQPRLYARLARTVKELVLLQSLALA